jgi:hypothetical protein
MGVTNGLSKISRTIILCMHAPMKSFQNAQAHFDLDISYCILLSIVCTFILQFYLSTLFMNKFGECYLPSVVCRHYFSISFNEKSAHYTQ